MTKLASTPVDLDLWGNPIEPKTKQTNGGEMFTLMFGDNRVRVLIKDGDPWFVASDVCRVLGLGNVSQALSRLDDDEYVDITSNDVDGNHVKIKACNESGLYSLILGSRKAEAKAFKKWVTREVLPSIRKTGGYSLRNASRFNKVKRRLHCDDETARRRIENTDQNKAMHKRMHKEHAKPEHIARLHNATYMGQFGMVAPELRTRLEISEKATPLDYMSALLLSQNTHAKTLVNQIVATSPHGIPIETQCEIAETEARKLALADQAALSRTSGEPWHLSVINDANRGKILGHVQRQLTA